ncbi:MAG: hypothetical protein H6581_18995 [Bacteroidia bacterium]|nr:hypothetical protein [Bacteroidia bacterium]
MNYIRPVYYSLLITLLAFGLLNLSSCKPKELLYGKWKVVEMHSGEFKFTDNPAEKYHLDEYYFEFRKDGKVLIIDKGMTNESIFVKEGNLIKDPNRGADGDMVISELNESSLIFSGVGEDGKPFTMYLKRVE